MAEVWITGVGLLTALGPDRETTWKRLLAAESGIRPLTLWDTSHYRTAIAAQVDDARVHVPDAAAPTLRHSTRASRLAVAAAAEALSDAALPLLAGDRPWGVVFGGGAAGLFEAEGFLERRLRGGPGVRGLSEIIEVPQDASSDRVAAAFRLTGPRLTISTACSSSTVAIGRAAELVRDGEVDVVLAGGSDALCRLTYAGFNSLRAVDPEPCRPFDRDRKGLSLGEGAAVLVLEDADRARQRGARPYAHVLGLGVTADAFHMTQPEPSGAAWERTIRDALRDAGIDATAVEYINAHGTATEQNDAAECAAYARVFGERLPMLPISSVKGALGHCLCAAGGIEAAITVLALARGELPPTTGLKDLDPACAIDAIPGHSRRTAARIAMSCSFAFGGNSAALLLGTVA